jgi:6-phosphofructokinase 1
VSDDTDRPDPNATDGEVFHEVAPDVLFDPELQPAGDPPDQPPRSLAVFTSGGDAPGMNAAVRAVVRTGLQHGMRVHVVEEGYAGLVAGGDLLREVGSEDVGGILHQGGSFIGSARSDEFRTRDGRRRAAANLVRRGIEALVVVGGDGSLTGADLFRREWPELLDELVEHDEVTREQADDVADLRLVGLVGSIDNDMFGTDMTIGADTALHRITEAVDAIRSTASSHQRSFVIEVMGRNCGYLALMASLATGANWVFIPESPPDTDDWAGAMCRALRKGREIGRRQNLVIVAEGAHDRHGEPITADMVRDVLQDELGEDTRVTILGHVQRGGAPSAFDRYLATISGHAAVEQLRASHPQDEATVIGFRNHQVVTASLVDSVERTKAVADRIAAQDHDGAMALRGGSFAASYETLKTLTRSSPHRRAADQREMRLAVLHAGGPAPGMNTAVRVAVRLGLDAGHTMLGVRRGFDGLRQGLVEDLDWMDVSEWVWRGGAELGISRYVPDAAGCAAIAEVVAEHRIDGLLMIGGWAGYQGAAALHAARGEHPELGLPIVCLPASINNDLPGTDVSIGADTALNSIVVDVDKIKQSAVASGRCFVVEVMGRDSGYLALLSGLATGAERVYLPEEGITLDDLATDVAFLRDGFAAGKRLGLVIRGEGADDIYTTGFLHALFEKEGGELFDVRQAVLGHVQQGGDPSPFDRVQGTRFAARCIAELAEQALADEPASRFIGVEQGETRFTDLDRLAELVDPGGAHRPREQRWRRIRPVARVMSGRDAGG